jgi:hypothetical protein
MRLKDALIVIPSAARNLGLPGGPTRTTHLTAKEVLNRGLLQLRFPRTKI